MLGRFNLGGMALADRFGRGSPTGLVAGLGALFPDVSHINFKASVFQRFSFRLY